MPMITKTRYANCVTNGIKVIYNENETQLS